MTHGLTQYARLFYLNDKSYVNISNNNNNKYTT